MKVPFGKIDLNLFLCDAYCLQLMFKKTFALREFSLSGSSLISEFCHNPHSYIYLLMISSFHKSKNGALNSRDITFFIL